MRIAVPHHTTRANARTTIEQKVAALLSQFGGRVDDLQQQWTGDTLEFKGKARGFKVEGTVEVTDEDRQRVDALVPPGGVVIENYTADFGPHRYRW